MLKGTRRRNKGGTKRQGSPPWKGFAPSTTDRHSPQWASVRFVDEDRFSTVKIGPNQPREIPEHLANKGAIVEIWHVENMYKAEVIFVGTFREADAITGGLSSASEDQRRRKKRPAVPSNKDFVSKFTINGVLSGDEPMQEWDNDLGDEAGTNREEVAMNVIRENAKGIDNRGIIQTPHDLRQTETQSRDQEIHDLEQTEMQGKGQERRVLSEDKSGKSAPPANKRLSTASIAGGSTESQTRESIPPSDKRLNTANVAGGSTERQTSNNDTKTDENAVPSTSTSKRRQGAGGRPVIATSDEDDMSSDESDVSEYQPSIKLSKKAKTQTRRGKVLVGKNTKKSSAHNRIPELSDDNHCSSTESEDSDWVVEDEDEIDWNNEPGDDGSPNNVKIVVKDNEPIIFVKVKDYGRRQLTRGQAMAYLKLLKRMGSTILLSTAIREFYKTFFPNWRKLTLSTDPRARKKRITEGMRELFFTCAHEACHHTQTFLVDNRFPACRSSTVGKNRAAVVQSVGQLKGDSKTTKQRRFCRLAIREPSSLVCSHCKGKKKVTREEQQGAACVTCYQWLCNAHAVEHHDAFGQLHTMCIVHKFQSYP